MTLLPVSRAAAFVIVCFTLIEAESSSGAPAPPSQVSFTDDVRPILARHCLACHGPDEEAREADLRLDLPLRDDSDVIVPEDADGSTLIDRVRSSDPDLRMPPPAAGERLSPDEIETLTLWIEQGARYETHWAFVAPERPHVPEVDNSEWCRNEIDHFIARKHAEHELAPAPAADPWALSRRVSLDLTGLPPTPEAADAFAADPTDEAFERYVDQLLDSPQFGEHWARMWLDLARYADTKGYEKDQPRNIWRYRDWVIDALNSDMPFDQFTIEQLAGDLLPDATVSQKLATAFHRNTLTNDEGGTDNEEFRSLAVKDRVDTTMQVWMGLTAGCAKCHTHKYDPISQREYYQLYAFFNQTADQDRSDDAPRLETPTPEQAQQRDAINEELQSLRDDDQARRKELEQQLQELKKQIPTTPVMRELAQNKRRETRIHLRGNFLDPGDAVESALPAAFTMADNYEADSAGNPDRLALAHWLMSPSNPLTSRVMVNRIWARLFGRGIVETEEDFGTQGSRPSHPALLDWLAVEFRTTHAWSLKALCRQMVLSATYRQSSAADASRLERDPANQWLARSPRVRLSAESVRDQALSVAGLLSQRIGGPSVMPPQPEGIWRTTYSTLKWTTPEDEDRYRRGLYTFLRRTSPYPSLITFDAGSREVCQIRRIRTNTPLQALVTMNDPAYVEAAGGLARHAAGKAEAVETMFRRVLIRRPDSDEADRLRRLLDAAKEEFQNDDDAAKALLTSARVDIPAATDELVEVAALTVVANVLLNLDETIMKP